MSAAEYLDRVEAAAEAVTDGPWVARPERTEYVAPSVAHPQPDGIPCAAHPSTGFRHFDGPCRCFIGGPAPEFEQASAS